MRIHSWFVTLGIVGVSAAATAVGCSSSPAAPRHPARTRAPTPRARRTRGRRPTPARPAHDGVGRERSGRRGHLFRRPLHAAAPTATRARATSCCTQLTTCDAADDAGAPTTRTSPVRGSASPAVDDFDVGATRPRTSARRSAGLRLRATRRTEQANAAAVFTCLQQRAWRDAVPRALHLGSV